jgi:hypothetical protein
VRGIKASHKKKEKKALDIVKKKSYSERRKREQK